MTKRFPIPSEADVEELKPIKDSRQDFYGKALIKRISTNCTMLYSYYQPVCYVYRDDEEVIITLNPNIDRKKLFSTTTLRHIKEFLYQFANVESITKSELIKMLSEQ